MNYLSVCSGIEAATVAWHSLGWKPVAFSEIEKFPSQVLKHHYPEVPNVGDMTKYKEWNFESNVDLLVGGTPCQSFSVAGLRKGLDDPRGNLMLTYLAIADKFRPTWLVWENVCGVLSSNGGKDFGTFLGGLGELGYGFAYRVLDAQYFGVAQRRRRVFVVGCLGSWQRAAAVLFERHSLSGNPAPSRTQRKSIAEGAESSSQRGSWWDGKQVSAFITTRSADQDMLDKANFQAVLQPIPINSMNAMRSPDAAASTGCGLGEEGEAMFTLTKGNHHAVAQPMVLEDQGGSVMNWRQDGTVGTLRRETHGHEPSIVSGMAVRRLTPKECERLQGFPDNYTDIKPSNKDTPDGPRYKALGNSMAVPVMAWIGKRIQEVENT